MDTICGTCQAEHVDGQYYNHNFVKRPEYAALKKFIGYCEKLPIMSGDKVTIKKRVIVRSRGENKPAGRTFTVQVHHVLNGYKPDAAEIAYQERHGNTAVGWNPKVVWPGSGGYWCEVDMNDIPEAQEAK